MAERIDLTTAIASAPRYFVQGLNLRRGMSAVNGAIVINAADSVITVVLLAENGQTKTHQWSGAGADADIVALKKVNLAAGNSLDKRILDKLISDGVIAGVSAGSPD